MYRTLIALLCCGYLAPAPAANFRDFSNAPEHVKNFYKLQHKYQTFNFVKLRREQLEERIREIKSATSLEDLKELERLGKVRLFSIWDAIEQLDEVIDPSDPDISLANSEHAFQTAQAIRNSTANHPDWFILAGLIHDLGKIEKRICEEIPFWAIVGDTFPVGCEFNESNIFHEYFAKNEDCSNQLFSTKMGIYSPNIGLKNVYFSYGHDEYAYQVFASQSKLPEEALAMVRFHSFYPMHEKRGYDHLMDASDQRMVYWISEFSKFDLYSKSPEQVSREELENFYKPLIKKYFPQEAIAWPKLDPIYLGN